MKALVCAQPVLINERDLQNRLLPLKYLGEIEWRILEYSLNKLQNYRYSI